MGKTDGNIEKKHLRSRGTKINSTKPHHTLWVKIAIQQTGIESNPLYNLSDIEFRVEMLRMLNETMEWAANKILVRAVSPMEPQTANCLLGNW